MSQTPARFLLKSSLLLISATLAAFGCSSNGNETSSGTDSQTSTAPQPTPVGSDAAGGAATTTPPATPASTAGLPLPVAGDPNASLVGDGSEGVTLDTKEVTTDDACAQVELAPEEIMVEVPHDVTTTTEVLQPVAFYIVLDNSSSMDQNLPGVANNNNGFNGGNNTPPTTMDPTAMDPTAMDPTANPQMQQLAGDAGVVSLDGGAPAADPVPTVTPTQTSADARTRWELAVGSLEEFVASPESSGVDVAIQYFNPVDQAGGNTGFGGLGDVPTVDSDVCTGAFHSTPDVQMGRLPDNAQSLVDSLDQARPNGYTPTVGALQGGVQYCEDFQAANPDERCVVVLVTDGLPHGCGLCQDDSNTNCFDPNAEATLAPIAAAGFAEGVRTFTVAMDGVPDDGFALLDAIAVAGGTDCTPPDPGGESCNVSSTGSAGLVDTLIAIRESVTVTETVTEVETVIEHETLECQWKIPTPPADQGELNPDRVNVQVALDGVNPDFILGVADEADCANNGGNGWYYDNPAAPTQIFACPGSCDAIQSAENPSIQILLGCARKTPELMK